MELLKGNCYSKRLYVDTSVECSFRFIRIERCMELSLLIPESVTFVFEASIVHCTRVESCRFEYKKSTDAIT